MCMGNCGGSKASSNHRSSGYTPKSKSPGRASSGQLPKGWSTGGGSNKAFGTPKVRATFGGRKS